MKVWAPAESFIKTIARSVYFSLRTRGREILEGCQESKWKERGRENERGETEGK